MLVADKENLIHSDYSVKMFIDGMNAAIWLCDLQENTVWWSDELYHLLGYQPGEIAIDRESFNTNIVHPDDLDTVKNAELQLLETRSSVRSEVRLKHRTKGYQWFKCGGKLSFDEEGVPLKLHGSTMNIHDRKTAEERVSMVIEGVEAGIWEWNITDNELWWSDKLYDLIGYKRDEVQLPNDVFLRSIVHPDDLQKMKYELETYLLNQSSYKVELRLLHKNGQYYWFESSGKCRVDENGVPVKMAGSMMNCHSRKILEEKYIHSEFLLNETGRISKVGGWELDVANNRPYWSKTTYDIHEIDYSYKPDLGEAIDFFHPDHQEKLRYRVNRAIHHGESYEIEMILITAKKRKIWVKLYGEPVYNELGDVVKLRGVFMDIDQAKKNQMDLEKSLELLARQNEQLSGFSHILSHNLRNHAGNISLIAGMLDDEALEEDFKDLVHNLIKVSNRLNSTLDEMSEALKLREDNTLQKELLPVGDIYNELSEVLSSTIASHHIKISSSFEVSHIMFPRIYMESILMNLISNAIKYRKTHIAPVIKIATYIDKITGRVCLECSDNGMGIDLKENGQKLFTLYKTFHTNKDAHGVGLFLIRTQIESQGGEITVQSELGAGSVFKVVF